jgi:hypothetical protein
MGRSGPSPCCKESAGGACQLRTLNKSSLTLCRGPNRDSALYWLASPASGEMKALVSPMLEEAELSHNPEATRGRILPG